jgi:thymidylate synthase (FAD)
MNTAKIVAVTEPKIYSDTPSGPHRLTVDEFVAYVARVSNPSNQNNNLTAQKLLKYLAKHKHFSPFEMVHIVMEINTTRDIGRQILRHRSFSFQEFSQRYADPTQDMGFVTREARLQDTKNRQNSIETNDEKLVGDWEKEQRLVRLASTEAYAWAIANGIAKEQARAVLPEGLIMSRMYMTGSLRSYWHFIAVRHHPAAQKEIRLVAASIAEQLIELFPSLKEMLEQMIADNYKDESNHNS